LQCAEDHRPPNYVQANQKKMLEVQQHPWFAL
jgi:hypothetical protein